MAKAKHVGLPHSLQLVLGSILKIWIPVSPIHLSPFVFGLIAAPHSPVNREER
jgi:hypothetical protein